MKTEIEWIPVSEKLPRLDDGDSDLEVIAWTHLPVPYEEARGNE